MNDVLKIFEDFIIDQFAYMIEDNEPMNINSKEDINKYIIRFIKQAYQENNFEQINDIDAFIKENCTTEYFNQFIENNCIIIDNYSKLIQEMDSSNFLNSFKSNILHDNSRMLDFQDITDIKQLKQYLWNEIQKAGVNWLMLNIQNKYLNENIIPIFILSNDDKERFNLNLLKELNVELLFDSMKIYKNFANLKKLKVGDKVKLDHAFLHMLTHDPSFKPIIYINGNIITSDKTSNIAGTNYRAYHSELVRTYFDNMSLHKNDIIHLNEDEWSSKDETRIDESLNCVRMVIKDGIIFIINFPKQAVIDAIKSELHYPIFCVTDDASGLIRRAKRLIGKQIYTRI